MSGNPGGPRAPFGDSDLCGIYCAIVTQNDDLKGPGGRVKVRFPWMPEGNRDQSHWAHVCVPMIGDGFGTYFMPEVEDSVYVVFVAGDIRAPMVIGGAWSKEDPPPETNEDGKNDFRLIKSRSGHRLLFDDTEKTKLIITDHKDENLVALGPHAEAGQSKTNTYEVPSPPGVSGSPTEGVSIAAMKGGLDIWCPAGTLSIEAETVELTATGDADIHAGKALTTNGSKTELVSSSASKFRGSNVSIGPGGTAVAAARKTETARAPVRQRAPAIAAAAAPPAAIPAAAAMPAAVVPSTALTSPLAGAEVSADAGAEMTPPVLPSTALSGIGAPPSIAGQAPVAAARGKLSIPSIPQIPSIPSIPQIPGNPLASITPSSRLIDPRLPLPTGFAGGRLGVSPPALGGGIQGMKSFGPDAARGFKAQGVGSFRDAKSFGPDAARGFKAQGVGSFRDAKSFGPNMAGDFKGRGMGAFGAARGAGPNMAGDFKGRGMSAFGAARGAGPNMAGGFKSQGQSAFGAARGAGPNMAGGFKSQGQSAFGAARGAGPNMAGGFKSQGQSAFGAARGAGPNMAGGFKSQGQSAFGAARGAGPNMAGGFKSQGQSAFGAARGAGPNMAGGFKSQGQSAFGAARGAGPNMAGGFGGQGRGSFGGLPGGGGGGGAGGFKGQSIAQVRAGKSTGRDTFLSAKSAGVGQVSGVKSLGGGGLKSMGGAQVRDARSMGTGSFRDARATGIGAARAPRMASTRFGSVKGIASAARSRGTASVATRVKPPGGKPPTDNG